MRSLVPTSIPPQPPLSWREVVVLLLLLPLWLPILAGGVAALVVGLLLAPDPPTDLEQAPDDDGRPDDYVPLFVPPRRQPLTRALPPARQIAIVPAPASAKSTTAIPTNDELDQIPARRWPSRFPGG